MIVPPLILISIELIIRILPLLPQRLPFYPFRMQRKFILEMRLPIHPPIHSSRRTVTLKIVPWVGRRWLVRRYGDMVVFATALPPVVSEPSIVDSCQLLYGEHYRRVAGERERVWMATYSGSRNTILGIFLVTFFPLRRSWRSCRQSQFRMNVRRRCSANGWPLCFLAY